ncbi:uncharacterized protein LOC133738700 [Rosa rugosa]|uniref:uncharacterized protein LOC133738700 n=1 Tax=Rosa rugosa TaxID=74645 RepID=UPI002B402D77|nr:uncharacterized protein LOC133738700 [Rosa rugosa]
MHKLIWTPINTAPLSPAHVFKVLIPKGRRHLHSISFRSSVRPLWRNHQIEINFKMRINYFNSIWRGSHIAEVHINGLAQVPRFPIRSLSRTKSEALISYPCSRNASVRAIGVETRTDTILKKSIAGGVQTIATNIILKEDVAA